MITRDQGIRPVQSTNHSEPGPKNGIIIMLRFYRHVILQFIKLIKECGLLHRETYVMSLASGWFTLSPTIYISRHPGTYIAYIIQLIYYGPHSMVYILISDESSLKSRGFQPFSFITSQRRTQNKRVASLRAHKTAQVHGFSSKNINQESDFRSKRESCDIPTHMIGAKIQVSAFKNKPIKADKTRKNKISRRRNGTVWNLIRLLDGYKLFC